MLKGADDRQTWRSLTEERVDWGSGDRVQASQLAGSSHVKYLDPKSKKSDSYTIMSHMSYLFLCDHDPEFFYLMDTAYIWIGQKRPVSPLAKGMMRQVQDKRMVGRSEVGGELRRMKMRRIVSLRWTVHPKGNWWDENLLTASLPLVFIMESLPLAPVFLWGLVLKLPVPSKTHCNGV